MPRRLTLKQKKFVKEYIASNGNATKAVIEAGYSVKNRHVAEHIGYENLRKPEIREEVETQLAKAGLTDEKLAKLLKENIEAGVGRKATASDSLRGIEMAFKLKDRFPSEKKQIQQASYRMELKGMSMAELREELRRLREKEKKLRQLRAESTSD